MTAVNENFIHTWPGENVSRLHNLFSSDVVKILLGKQCDQRLVLADHRSRARAVRRPLNNSGPPQSMRASIHRLSRRQKGRLPGHARLRATTTRDPPSATYGRFATITSNLPSTSASKSLFTKCTRIKTEPNAAFSCAKASASVRNVGRGNLRIGKLRRET